MPRLAVLPLLSLLSAAAGAVGCADPNPTFVFDAAPTVVVDAGSDTGSQDGAGDAAQVDDGGTDADAEDAEDAGGSQ